MPAAFAKEFRPLFLPVCAVAAIGLTGYIFREEARSLMLPLFVAGCAYIGSLPFGIEFQQRTFALLLSQPQTRWRLWLRKNGVIATAVIAVGLGFYRVWHF